MKNFYVFLLGALCACFLHSGTIQADFIQAARDIVNYTGDNVAQKVSRIPVYKDHQRTVNDIIGLLIATRIYQLYLQAGKTPDVASSLAWTLGAAFRQLLHRLSASGRTEEYGIIPTVAFAAGVGFVIDKVIHAKLTEKTLNYFLPITLLDKAKLILGLLLFTDRNIAINKEYPAFIASLIDMTDKNE